MYSSRLCDFTHIEPLPVPSALNPLNYCVFPRASHWFISLPICSFVLMFKILPMVKLLLIPTHAPIYPSQHDK